MSNDNYDRCKCGKRVGDGVHWQLADWYDHEFEAADPDDFDPDDEEPEEE